MVSPESEMCPIAFKEWAGVCDAMIEGRQSVIIRKGGITESAGPGQFDPEHREFWLYPTWVHQAEQGLRSGSGTPVRAQPAGHEGSISIGGFVCIDLFARVDSERSVSSLEEFHIFTAETILKRFHYRRPGFWVLSARVWRRDPAYTVAKAPDQAGCKTWVELPEPLSTRGLHPVLDDDEWMRRRDRLLSVLDRQI